MIGHYLLPIFHPLWVFLHQFCASRNVTPLAFRMLQIFTLLSALVFMAVQMTGAGVAAFIIHFVVMAVARVPAENTPPSATTQALHSVGFSAATVFAIAFGVADNFGMPVAFLFLSWIILILTNLTHPSTFQFIGLFEIGLAVVVMGLVAAYIPAIAILFGLACLVSAGITLMMGKRLSA